MRWTKRVTAGRIQFWHPEPAAFASLRAFPRQQSARWENALCRHPCKLELRRVSRALHTLHKEHSERKIQTFPSARHNEGTNKLRTLSLASRRDNPQMRPSDALVYAGPDK